MGSPAPVHKNLGYMHWELTSTNSITIFHPQFRTSSKSRKGIKILFTFRSARDVLKLILQLTDAPRQHLQKTEGILL